MCGVPTTFSLPVFTLKITKTIIALCTCVRVFHQQSNKVVDCCWQTIELVIRLPHFCCSKPENNLIRSELVRIKFFLLTLSVIYVTWRDWTVAFLYKIHKSPPEKIIQSSRLVGACLIYLGSFILFLKDCSV